MRMWLRRVELDAMLTAELQKIAGCERSTLIAGAPISIADFEHSNWADFTVSTGVRIPLGTPTKTSSYQRYLFQLRAATPQSHPLSQPSRCEYGYAVQSSTPC